MNLEYSMCLFHKKVLEDPAVLQKSGVSQFGHLGESTSQRSNLVIHAAGLKLERCHITFWKSEHMMEDRSLSLKIFHTDLNNLEKRRKIGHMYKQITCSFLLYNVCFSKKGFFFKDKS